MAGITTQMKFLSPVPGLVPVDWDSLGKGTGMEQGKAGWGREGGSR